jgi:hypothetical protein
MIIRISYLIAICASIVGIFYSSDIVFFASTLNPSDILAFIFSVIEWVGYFCLLYLCFFFFVNRY